MKEATEETAPKRTSHPKLHLLLLQYQTEAELWAMGRESLLRQKNRRQGFRGAESLSRRLGPLPPLLRKKKWINQPAMTNIQNQNYPPEKTPICPHVPIAERRGSESGTETETENEKETVIET